MKTKLILILLMAAVQCLYAQEFQRIDLQSRKWIGADETSLSLFFTDREMIIQIEGRDGSVLKTPPIEYYMSATNDKTFDHSLVGKNESGKYIKTYEKLERGNVNIDHITIYTIKELTNTKLVYMTYVYEYENEFEPEYEVERVYYNLPVSQIPHKQEKTNRYKKLKPLSHEEVERRTQELKKRINEDLNRLNERKRTNESVKPK